MKEEIAETINLVPYWRGMRDRAAVCVDACDGIPTERLAPGMMSEMLAALERCAEALAHVNDVMGVRVNPPTLDNARAAIAKAKGE